MKIVCGFRNIQEMAKSVTDSAQQIEGRGFSPRPWNRFEPDNTDWWIVPSTNWPAYRFGKGMFRLVDYFPGEVLCCLNVEKGFARVVGEAFPSLVSSGQIIDKQWSWFSFLTGLKDGSITRAAGMMEQETGLETIMEISAWYPKDHESFEPHSLPINGMHIDQECRSSDDAGRIWYSISGDEFSLLGKRCVGEIMASVVDCHTLSDLSQALQTNPELSWTWIDVYIGVLVSLLPHDQKQSDAWDSSQIWQHLFRPWSPWIV